MIRDLVINDVQVRIWQSVVPAPVVDHPIRAQRHHPHRQAEFDIIAALMPQPWSWDDIAKDPLGKPRLKNGNPHIGISHSNGIGCFAWSNREFGIDIQTTHPSIFKVRNKYCHPEELEFLRNEATDSRHLMLWSAKEAIYKFYGHGIEFSHDLIAQPFQESDDKISIVCQIHKDKCITFSVDCLQQENFILTIAQTFNHENHI